MFSQIFLFEIKYRLRRPAFYVYFALIFFFAFFSFAQGNLPLIEKEFINAPASLAIFSAMSSLFMMLVSSVMMGTPMYRDIEHNTKEYYLSYPITKAGYFWGRFLGSFSLLVVISAAVYIGAWVGTKAGPALGWTDAGRYGPNHFYFYAYPFFTVMIPSLLFTSAFFFGLVAIFRNVKVIYSSGMFLLLGYLLANFFLHNINNPKVIYLADPFCFNGLRMEIGGIPADQLNASVVRIQGLLLTNRIIWASVGALILALTYWRFSFQKFFSGRPAERRADRRNAKVAGARQRIGPAITTVPSFDGSYTRRTLYSLTRIEVLNIIRDNFFWIILSGGIIFLSIVFVNGSGRYGVSDYPRTSFIMNVFNEDFLFFIFLIVIFYTGEAVHREKVTRYAFINDALPPPTWVLNFAKLLGLCCLALGLALVPVLLGICVQLAKGYYDTHLPLYAASLFVFTLPKLIEMVLFSYAIHIVVNNKFAAHGIGITIWLIMLIMLQSDYFTYRLLLYSYGPSMLVSDMDGVGHLLKPALWFNGHWLLAGAFLVVAGSLFYARGTGLAFGERFRLARQRWTGTARAGAWILLVAFFVVGGYIYYNVSFLNNYLTDKEEDMRAAMTELQLKKSYAGLPLPKITRIIMQVDLYPEEQAASTRALLTIRNKSDRPIDSLLLDGDNLTEFSIAYNGVKLEYTCPLYFPRGKYNLFRPAKEASDYRLYRLPAALKPGDTALLEVQSLVRYEGFQNGFYAMGLLHNGTFFKGGLPGFGYDEGEELRNSDKRKKYGLPLKTAQVIPQDDPKGRNTILDQNEADLVKLDIAVSTDGNQTAIAPGMLSQEWMAGGRHYYHYVQDKPGIYLPGAIASARYAIQRDTVLLDNNQEHARSGDTVLSQIYYHPAHALNLPHFEAAYRDGLSYYSKAFGPYPYRQMNLIESSEYGPFMLSYAGTTVYSGRFGWNADLRAPGELDYCYYNIAEQLARQWWGLQVAPNSTVGAPMIRDGIAKYAAIMLMERKYGTKMGVGLRQEEYRGYSRGRRWNDYKESDLLHADKGYLYNEKTGLMLHGLKELIGEDSLNAALHEFQNSYALRDGGPYAGSPDLYRVLQAHVPDSFRYYLTDTWEKVCQYNNEVLDVKAVPLGANDKYKVTIKVRIGKTYFDSTGKEQAASGMNDYIDIGVFGADKADKKGYVQYNPLYLKKHRLTEGEHTIELVVKGRPTQVGIDPYKNLIDRRPDDNARAVD